MSRNIEITEMSEIELLNIFASNLKYMMEYTEINQRELAIRSGISEATISKYLNSKVMPSLRAIVNFCYALDCDVYDLIPTACVVIE